MGGSALVLLPFLLMKLVNEERVRCLASTPMWMPMDLPLSADASIEGVFIRFEVFIDIMVEAIAPCPVP